MYAPAQASAAGKTRLSSLGAIDHNRMAGLTHYVVFAFLVGTGGCETADYLAKRNNQGYRFINLHGVPNAPETAIQEHFVRTPAENLARVREVLKPTITELANLFGVSRQAVYDWQAGKPTAPENAAKLDDLAKAADTIALTGVESSSQMLRRKILDGKSLLDVVREGGAVANAAQMLAQILSREAKQRKQLAVRLAGRNSPHVPHDEHGVPMLDERS
jgi:transcriptional regulator with XRE-family HTH domain